MALKQTVKRGQSLVDLMKKFNSTSNRLLRDNPQLRRGVRPGTVLNVRQPPRPPISNYNYYAQYRPAANVKQARDIIRQQSRPRPVVQQPVFRDERRFVQQNRPAQAVQRPRQPAFQPTRFGPIPTQPRQQVIAPALARLYQTRPTLPGAPALARAIQSVTPETFNAPVRRLVNAALPGTRFDLAARPVALSPADRVRTEYGIGQATPLTAQAQQAAQGRREVWMPANMPEAQGFGPNGWRGPIEDWKGNLESSNVDYLFSIGQLPLVFTVAELRKRGYTAAELESAGYVQDDYGNWIRQSDAGGGEPAPSGGTYGSAGGGRRYYGGGGGGGGGGGYSGVYPYEQQQQRGVSPTGRDMRRSRFGQVSWRGL